jgi:trans-aconitate 2-methyltransferase
LSWDPGRYLRFGDLRLRPGLELLSRVDAERPRLVVDLGCGPGNLTALLAQRWPTAQVTGVDSSAAMLEAARREYPAISWVDADLGAWTPPSPLDVLFSNAALHWLIDHDGLFPRLVRLLAPGGVLAVQMPANWTEPTHTIPAAILDSGDWPPEAVAALARHRVSPPATYHRLLTPYCDRMDIWSTTYQQRVVGDDPVLRWVEGSVLAPVLDALDEEQRALFRRTCADAYRRAYPPEADGTTVLPFTRLFIVARRSA